MSTDQPRIPAGSPDGGQFAAAAASESVATLPTATIAPPPFRFDQNRMNYEQVRPYFEGYLACLRDLEQAGAYPYNGSFKGRVPGIEGPDEDTAIYMLQQMKDRDDMSERRDAFIAEGGRTIGAEDLALGEVLRGTVATYGFYVGGTGWREYPSVRLVLSSGRDFVVLERGRRRGTILTGKVLFRPHPTSPKQAAA